MSAVQYSAKFDLIGPDGTIASFNDPTDVNYVGMLSGVTGLESPEVVEQAENLVGADGGVHGDFYHGRRPIVLEGIMLNPASAVERNERMDRLSRASNAMRRDAVLTWESDGLPRQSVSVRRQQPLRFEGAWQKAFMVALVAADPRIYSFFQHAETADTEPSGTGAGRAYPRTYPVAYGPSLPGGSLIINNAGNEVSYPIIRVQGPGTNPSLHNLTTGETLRLNYQLGSEDYLVIDMLNRTVLLQGVSDRYSAVDFLNSQWWGLDPGENDIRVAFSQFSTGSSINVTWRDAWL